MKYPRLYELYTAAKKRSWEIENLLRKGDAQLDDWEQALQELESEAWMDFLKKAQSRDFTCHPINRLKTLFEFINEAKGYILLKNYGCREIKFIPESDTKTPDIEASCGTGKVILEVKTINLSEENVGCLYWNSYNTEMNTLDVQTTLSDGLKKKMNSICKDTKEKLAPHENLCTV
jgi:hypothetical protein